MARSEISSVVLLAGLPVTGAFVQVNLRSGGTATVYSAETGVSTLTNPLTTDSQGRITGWLEENSYDLVVTHASITTYTERYEAVSGSPSRAVTINSLTTVTLGVTGASTFAGISASGNITVSGSVQGSSVIYSNISTGNAATLGYYAGAIGPGLSFGLAYDTNLYRAAAGALKTDGSMRAASFIGASGVSYASDGQLNVASGVANDQIVFKNSSVELARFNTSLQFVCGPTIKIGWSAAAATGVTDTSIYRYSAGAVGVSGSSGALATTVIANTSYDSGNSSGTSRLQLNFNDHGAASIEATKRTANISKLNLYAEFGYSVLAQGITIDPQSTTQPYVGLGIQSPTAALHIGSDVPSAVGGIKFGSTGDTNLYRLSTGTLKTDGGLQLGAGATLVSIGGINGNPGFALGAASDTNLYRSAANTLATDGSLFVIGSLGRNIVTSLPASPYDGQECLYQADAANGIIWHLRYRAGSTSTYKWEFVGGSPLLNEVSASETTSSAAYVALATAGPSIAVPLAGDYVVALGSATANTAAGQETWMSYDIGATAATDADRTAWTAATVVDKASANSREKLKTLPIATLTAKHRVGGGTGRFQDRWMKVTPVRVG